MAPVFNQPPPEWKVNNDTGYAELVVDARQFLYHDVDPNEAIYWASQSKTQSLKALFEGGEYAYEGWREVPCFYIGTIEDRGLPFVVQRVTVGMARGQGAVVEHVELQSSHSPFLSMPNEVADIIHHHCCSKCHQQSKSSKGYKRVDQTCFQDIWTDDMANMVSL